MSDLKIYEVGGWIGGSGCISICLEVYLLVEGVLWLFLKDVWKWMVLFTINVCFLLIDY
jgi:hypothetical protein